MASWFVGIALPLALYFGLVFLPRAGAIRLLILTGMGLGVLWTAYFLKVGGSGALDPVKGAYSVLMLLAFTIALVLGGTMMVMKTRLPETWPTWSWPICVLVALVAVGIPLVRMFGM
ncbi:hypothetical protein [Roseovarius rhodophyticola]|uniref:DUF4175 domain-containing protein n=1 Tax=Roseovarius rhodophyticola TaxID=3080827 RepID=A0ABZ2TEX5_9RHOB|nr:hypothetical protein [Roseovarius sp. W115]MDV2928515.1 hypothetical protein [Roseovarius sp. W115]